jgi:Sec-independent protein translocase protein TatA
MQDLVIVLVVILILVLLWRGPKTLPSLGAALGRGVREAKEEATKVQSEIQARTAGEPIPPAETPSGLSPTEAPPPTAAPPTAAPPTETPPPADTTPSDPRV